VYSYEIVPEAREEVDGLPTRALASYAEVITFLELTPWQAPAYRDDNPEGNMRAMPFGPNAEGMTVYVILEEQRRVVVVSVIWVD
jgi:hypothetical protein